MAACFSKFTKKKQPLDYILTSRNIQRKKKRKIQKMTFTYKIVQWKKKQLYRMN